MLAYILGISKQGNKGITNLGWFYGLQIRAKGITKSGSLRGFKPVPKDYKLGNRFHIGAKRSQIGEKKITNWGMDFKSGQGLQIGAEHSTTV